MREFLVVASAALLIVTAMVHSILGERLLLVPMLQQRSGVLASGLARFIVRFAWHLTSLTWAVLATTLIALSFLPQHAFRVALIATGIAFTAAGIFDAFGSRGRHMGWPLLTGIGVAALAAAAFDPPT